MKLVAVLPNLEAEDSEDSLKEFFDRHSMWMHDLNLIDYEVFKQIMGYKNYVGRVLVSESDKILLAQAGEGSEVERFAFISDLQNRLKVFDLK